MSVSDALVPALALASIGLALLLYDLAVGVVRWFRGH
jgi:hypothetical protein